ncbi:hypothetical protein BDR07DRAFT_1502581, partial [Suillus spraguei]
YNTATAAGSRPLTPHDAHNLQYQLQQAIQHAEENPDLNQDIDPESNPLEDIDEYQDILGEAQPAEDDTDPFFIVDGLCAENTTDLMHLPGHLVSIYAVVSWLHLQFHLPKVACNALLAIFACILLTLSPNIEPPFVTLQSSNRVLGVDKPIYTLPVCPSCRDVFPPACSLQSHDQCTLCNEDLFLPDKTAHGNQRSLKSPLIKYPYLPLSDQIKSLLKVPGLKSILDGWCSKQRAPNQYINIFDGSVCKTKLKALDAGPDGELRVGVNLGVDWFSYIRSNIAPSHSSCPTSFSICNLPPKYRYRTSNLMCTSILPGPKEQNPDQIQRFLRPIISFIVPGSCGRLPTDIGMPSGGSLTADQWLLLATTYGPIIIPQLWSTCLPSDSDDQILHQWVAMIQKLENKKEADATCKLEDRTALAEAKKCGKEAFEAKKVRIARDKVAAAEAKSQEKLQLAAIKQTEKAQLAAEKKAKAVQRKGKRKAIEQNVEAHEPVDGDLEPASTKFSLHPDDPPNFLKFKTSLPCTVAEIMLKASNEERGTVAGLMALSKDLDNVNADAGQSYALSPRHQKTSMTTDTYRLLAQTLCFRYPLAPVYCLCDRTAIFFDYVVIKGKRYYASRTVRSNRSSFVHVVIPADNPIHLYGEVLEIFQVDQSWRRHVQSLWFAHVRWFKPWQGDAGVVWVKFTESVSVRLWTLGEYLEDEVQLPHLIDPDWINGQLAMTVFIGVEKTKVWATINLAKVRQMLFEQDKLIR